MSLINRHKSTPNQSTQYLTLTETTGVYSAANLGGYGADQTPLGDREITDIDSSNFSILTLDGTLTYEGSTSTITTNELYSTSYNLSNAQLIANGTTKTFDLGNLIGTSYTDGIHKSIYYNWFNGISTSTLDFTENSNEVVANDITEFINAKFLNVTGVNKIFEISSINTDTNTIILTTIWTDVTQQIPDGVWLVAYQSTAYFANTYNINKCLHSKIAQLSLSTCSCKNKATEKLYEAVMLYMSIQPNMDLGKYTKAQEIIQALTIYCNGGECNC